MQKTLEKDLLRAIKSAKLSLKDDADHAEVLSRMEKIMAALEELQTVDVDAVQPLYLPTEQMLKEMMTLRSDQACHHIDADTATKHAPDTQKKLFLLPQMID